MSAFGGKADIIQEKADIKKCPLMTQSGHCVVSEVTPGPFQNGNLTRYDVPYRGSGAVMRRRDQARGKAAKAQRRKTLKRRNTVKVARRRKRSAVDATETIALLTRERDEALEQQIATSEVLKVISSSPGELAPVFNVMLENAVRICDAKFGHLWLREGENLRVGATHGAPEVFAAYLREEPVLRPKPETGLGQLLRTKQLFQLEDIAAVPTYGDKLREATINLAGARSLIGVPMVRDKEVIGAIVIYRQEVRPFTDKQIELVQNFAAQAVIAIENTRLLSELRHRTDDLSEALEQQMATSEVLRVISSSPTNVQPVFDAIAESAVRLCDGQFSFVLRFDGKVMDFASCCGLSAEGLDAFHCILPMSASEDTASGRAVVRRAVVEIPDVEADPSYGAQGQGLAKAVTYRSIAAVPLLHEGNPIGTIAVARANAGSFPKRQIVLLQAFADQAVIAIENVRLFDEVQARTRDLSESLQQQTATADVLKVISRSTFDLQTVLDALIESATRLCGATRGHIFQFDGEYLRFAAAYGAWPGFIEHLESHPLRPGRGTIAGRAAFERRTIHSHDVLQEPSYELMEAVKQQGYRTVLSVPMLREGDLLGVITILKTNVEPFTTKQIELIETFADQAMIAIENVRLFDSVEARTRELTKSLEDLRTAQDRLVQTEKLASLGQLTAGIAHEIKNPLNFVNNFSGVSVELIDELRQALAGANLDNKLRAEINEIADMLQNNLDKVVQHGKRADAIVKNMLLHSRQGSGERRLIDVNALVEESFNLAYHGARAEKNNFDVMVEQSLDPAAGKADLFPQEITRVLLNLISNGVYATAKKAQTNDESYKPTLTASTKSFDDRVEIKIRDNGTGISPEIKDRMFNPFFTTKPAGEGTGLGLSISHDIIVKQHGGSIEVDTQPGEFTEVRIILSRTAATIA